MAPTEEGRSVVCDAGPLIHLDELNSLALLADFGAIVVPNAVWDEVERHRPSALSQKVLSFSRRSVEISQDSRFQALVKAFALGAGEQAALSWLCLNPSALFLSDDAAARLAAKALSVRSYGTVGVLLRSLRRGQRTRAEVLTLLRLVPTHSTLHIRRGLVKEIIEKVEDSRV
jgi:predicted nucleic acid-binding protein